MVPRRGLRSTRLSLGALIEVETLETVNNGHVRIPDEARAVHLQFRRFAGCPICHLHLQRMIQRHDEIHASGILEIVVFHSTREQVSEFSDVPFALVADPERRLYERFGVEPSLRAVLDPRSWPAAALGVVEGLRHRSRWPSIGTAARGGPFGLPADFLIGRDGRLLARSYGTHADDQWSVDELLALARAADRPLTTNQPQPD